MTVFNVLPLLPIALYLMAFDPGESKTTFGGLSAALRADVGAVDMAIDDFQVVLFGLMPSA
jgi:hypothetical protein